MIVAFISALVATIDAKPLDRASWFKAGDYPLEAVVKRIEGSVAFEVDVDTEGKPTNCRVTKSSGEPMLDQKTCEVVLSRAHFKPALDKGKPIAGRYSTNAVWRLAGAAAAPTTRASDESAPVRTLFSADDYPAEAVRNGWEGEVVADLTISPEGRVSACTIVQSSGHAVLDQATCDIIRNRAMFKPAADANGKPVEDHARTPPVRWALSTFAGAAISLPKGWQQLAPGHLLCSEPAGEVEAYGIPSLETGKPMKFRFRLVSDHYDPTFGVNAALVFNTPSGEVRFQVGRALGDARYLFVGLQGGSKDADNWVFLDPFADPDRWFDVKMELDTTGVVRIVTENARGSLRLGTTQPVQTVLQCNSGAFEVEMSPTSSVEHALRP